MCIVKNNIKNFTDKAEVPFDHQLQCSFFTSF